MTDCLRCFNPVADTGYCCHACATRLKVALLRAGLLMSPSRDNGGAGLLFASDLEVTVPRLDRIGEGGPSSAESSLPFSWDASDAAWAVTTP